MVCLNGYQTQLIVDFEFRNNSLVPVFKEVVKQCSRDYTPIIGTVFLIIIFSGAFILNAMVLITISLSQSLKKALFHHLILNICTVMMFDCLFNMILSISYVATWTWKFGNYLCFFNSFTMSISAHQMTFSIFLLSMDRYLVANKVGNYMKISKAKLYAVIIATWLISFAASLPLSWGLISSVPFRHRYSCSITDKFENEFLLYHLIFLIVILPIAILYCVIGTIFVFHKEQKRHKRQKGYQTFKYFDQILMTPYYKNEVHSSLSVVLITVCYMLFWLPFLGFVTIDPFFTNYWQIANETDVEIIDPSRPETRMATFGNNFVNYSESKKDLLLRAAENSNINMTIMEEDYMSEVISSTVYETVFIWLRYLTNLLIPIIIMSTIKDIRLKSNAIIFFCRPNTVASSSPKTMRPPSYGTAMKINQSNKKKEQNTVNFKTPVLFCTSSGLYIRKAEGSNSNLLDAKPFLSFSKSTSDQPDFTYDICDISIFHQVADIDQSDKRYIKGDPIDTNTKSTKRKSADLKKTFLVPKLDDKNAIELENIQKPSSPLIQSASEENTKEIILEEGIKSDNEPRDRTSGKNVRFNTALNMEFTRPPTVDSTQSSSTISTVDSEKDTEEIFPVHPFKKSEAKVKLRKFQRDAAAKKKLNPITEGLLNEERAKQKEKGQNSLPKVQKKSNGKPAQRRLKRLGDNKGLDALNNRPRFRV